MQAQARDPHFSSKTIWDMLMKIKANHCRNLSHVKDEYLKSAQMCEKSYTFIGMKINTH